MEVNMKSNDYLNIIFNENNENIDFEKEFFNAGLSVEKNITENDVDLNELEMGIEVEMEHTRDSKIARKIARKIALDHLAEVHDYYTRLKKMEKEYKDENVDL